MSLPNTPVALDQILEDWMKPPLKTNPFNYQFNKPPLYKRGGVEPPLDPAQRAALRVKLVTLLIGYPHAKLVTQLHTHQYGSETELHEITCYEDEGSHVILLRFA